MIDYLAPHIAYLVLGVVAVLLSALCGWVIRGPVTKTKTVFRDVIPPELSRLARNIGITKDLPVSESYGRKIHDLFEEKDRAIFSARCENMDLTDVNEALQARVDRCEKIQVWTVEGIAWVDPGKECKAHLADLEQQRKDNAKATYNKRKAELKAKAAPGVVTFAEMKSDRVWTLDITKAPQEVTDARLLALSFLGGAEPLDSMGNAPCYYVEGATNRLYYHPTGCWTKWVQPAHPIDLGITTGLEVGYYLVPA